MFRITEDPSWGSLVQCLAKNYKNDSIVSVDMGQVGVMAAYSDPLCVCVFHCIWRHYLHVQWTTHAHRISLSPQEERRFLRRIKNSTKHVTIWSKNNWTHLSCESYVYWTVHHLVSWIKRGQLDVTCFIISLFNAQHVSDVNTSIFRSLRLICWVILWVVLLWLDVCWCYVEVWLGWCGIRMQASACIRIPQPNH